MSEQLQMTTFYDSLVTHYLKQLSQPQPSAQSDFQTLTIIRYALMTEQLFKAQAGFYFDNGPNC